MAQQSNRKLKIGIVKSQETAERKSNNVACPLLSNGTQSGQKATGIGHKFTRTPRYIE